MTPDAQQPEHCEHECVCPRYVGTAYDKRGWSCNVIGCVHDLRTRPHTPAPDAMAFKDSVIEQQQIHINNLNSKMAEMMQGAARAATLACRDIVFNKVIYNKCPFNGDCSQCFLCDNAGGCIIPESLSQKAGEQE